MTCDGKGKRATGKSVRRNTGFVEARAIVPVPRQTPATPAFPIEGKIPLDEGVGYLAALTWE